MTGQGRPIRFLALVALGWVGVRIALLWSQTGSLPEAIRRVVPHASPVIPGAVAAPVQVRPVPAVRAAYIPVLARQLQPSPPQPPHTRRRHKSSQIRSASRWRCSRSSNMARRPRSVSRPCRCRLSHKPSRWSASAWLVARPGTGLGAAPGAARSAAARRAAHRLSAGARAAAGGLCARRRRRWRGAARKARWVSNGSRPARRCGWSPSSASGSTAPKGRHRLGVIAGFDGRCRRFPARSLWPGRRDPARADRALCRRRRRATRVVAEGGGVRLALGGGRLGRGAARCRNGWIWALRRRSALPLGGRMCASRSTGGSAWRAMRVRARGRR
jgi:hypothetical protein